MPNGHIHYEACDQLHWTFTEQGYPEFRIDRYHYSRIVRVIHLRGVRGYAPDPLWETFQPPDSRLGKKPERGAVEALAVKYAAALQALLTSNPKDALSPSVRSASLAWFSFEVGWAVVIGDYSLYMRIGDEPLREIEKPVPGLPPDIEMTDEMRAQWSQMKIMFATAIGVDGPQSGIKPEECVHDLQNVTELLCSTTPLHASPGWPRIAASPVFSAESAGFVAEAMRACGLKGENDQLTLRWRRPEGE
ncbi:hypothetical protein [Polyangium sorediatum]|uniref:Uncharacterized protein n=1 Tax=Polyangium sorediatum TaxID=889274 RepID=A0ABT6NVE0_9BACT|nr:hypothetical protein [Polyangium sorediatum]MDI1432311.1 hypothetical protein [Polyangium sorediatum]